MHFQVLDRNVSSLFSELNAWIVAINCEDVQYTWVQKLNWSPSSFHPIFDLICSSLNAFTIFLQQPQLPQTQSWMFTEKKKSCLGSLSTQRVTDQRRARQGNKKSPKVLCRQSCDICALWFIKVHFGLNRDTQLNMLYRFNPYYFDMCVSCCNFSRERENINKPGEGLAFLQNET